VAKYKGKGAGVLNGIDKDLNVVDDIEIKRLGWASHILGMDDERFPQKKRFSMRNFPTYDQ